MFRVWCSQQHPKAWCHSPQTNLTRLKKVQLLLSAPLLTICARTELYATKWVDINVHRISLEPPKRVKPPSAFRRFLEYISIGKQLLVAGKSMYARLENLANGKGFGSRGGGGSGGGVPDDGAAYVVIIQEGIGAVLSKDYDRMADENESANPIIDITADEGTPPMVWTTRTLVLPCPAVINPDGTRQRGIIRTYCLREPHGMSYITINTQVRA